MLLMILSRRCEVEESIIVIPECLQSTRLIMIEESCMRWRALRVYIREWAKQHPNMAGDGLGGAGIAVRKGSWAV